MKLLLALSIILGFTGFQSASSGYHLASRYPVPGDGGFDYLEIDAVARRLYISHGIKVDVLDADTGNLVGSLPDTPGVHGIAVARPFGVGFTSNGRENKVSMFDLKTLALVKKIDVGKGPDGIYFDPGTGRVFTNNHGTHNISAIDASTGTLIGTVNVKGDGEQAVLGKDGLIYVNLEDTSEVVAFNPRTLAVEKRFSIGLAKTPTGLAYDEKTNTLFIGCHDGPKMVAMSASDGKVFGSFDIGKGVDFAGFDPKEKLIFFSCSDGTLSIYREKSLGIFEDAGAVKTQPSARTMAFDPKTGKIFLSAAEYEEIPPAEPGKRPGRRLKPGSFSIIVVSRQ